MYGERLELDIFFNESERNPNKLSISLTRELKADMILDRRSILCGSVIHRIDLASTLGALEWAEL